MASSYYEILLLNKLCSNQEIYESYKTLSLKYNPKTNSSKDFAINNYNFHQVTEAFLVLSNAKMRGVYDIYGKEGLKNGVTNNKGELIGGFLYSGNAFQVFEKFFGTTNPFLPIRDNSNYSENPDEYGSMFNSGFGGLYQKPNEKTIDIELEFYLTLEEINIGGIFVFKYSRQVLNEDKRSSSNQESRVDIQIPKGIFENTKFEFKEKGNEVPGSLPSNLFVTVKTHPHKVFRRNKSDLMMIYSIKLSDAINSAPLIINTLDGRRIDLAVDEIISPSSVKLVKGEGLPNPNIEHRIISNKEKEKGDLYIKFNIIFPKEISNEDKEKLIELLDTY